MQACYSDYLLLSLTPIPSLSIVYYNFKAYSTFHIIHYIVYVAMSTLFTVRKQLYLQQ